MQEQYRLTKEQEAAFYGQVVKAITEHMTKEEKRTAKPKKPTRMMVHPVLYQQLVPIEQRVKGGPIRCFTIPVEPEIGVPYGSFVFETETDGIIKGH